MNKKGSWWQSQSPTTRQTLFVLVTVALFASLAGALLSNDWRALMMHFGLQMAGAVATFVLIDQILSRNEERKLLNCELIPRLRSRVNAVALSAVGELSQNGWLYDGSIEGAYLSGANLQGAKMRDSNLQEALLVAANLQRVDLFRANLQGTHFWRANLREANLTAANLLDAVLHEANLTGAIFDNETVLPDGTNWNPDTDMKRFTDPKHPNAWRRDYMPTVPIEVISPPWGMGEPGKPNKD
jgi:uncharacterized protein YjbI with pentapeptide repeats